MRRTSPPIGCRRLRQGLAAAAFVLLLVPTPALAGGFHRDHTLLPTDVTSNGAGTSAPVSAGSTSGAIVRTVVGLAIVLAVIYGVYWLLRTYSRTRATRGDERVEVIATTPLSPNRTLHLVRAGDQVILLGATDGGITAIQSWHEDEAPVAGARAAAEPPTPAQAVAAQTGRAVSAFAGGGGVVDLLRGWTMRQ